MKIKTFLIAAGVATLAMASSIVACAKEGDVYPRYKSNCDLMNCSGQHISVKDPAIGIDVYFCVPQNLTYSVDEYREKVAEYLADRADGKVVEEEAPAAEETKADDSDYFAPPRLKVNCNLMNCSGQHISVFNPASGVHQYYCVPLNLTYSVGEYQEKVAEYLEEMAK